MAGLGKLTDNAVESVATLLCEPISAVVDPEGYGVDAGVPLGRILGIDHYRNLMTVLSHYGRRHVAMQMANVILENKIQVKAGGDAAALLEFLGPLIQDQPDGPNMSAYGAGNDVYYHADESLKQFAEEQEVVSKVVLQVGTGGKTLGGYDLITGVQEAQTRGIAISEVLVDSPMSVFRTYRKILSTGGPRRMRHSMTTLLHKVFELVPIARGLEIR